jgi:predicted transglutaminase-like cysteine proteinase
LWGETGITSVSSRRVWLGRAAAGAFFGFGSSLPGAAGTGYQLFGYAERFDRRPPAAQRLRATLARYRHQMEGRGTGFARTNVTEDGVKLWDLARSAVANSSGIQAIELANRLVNATPYKTDLDNYGVIDRWSTPLELMSRGGDCECYAIAKYVLLHQAATISTDAFRLVILAATAEREAHAVLAVVQQGRFFVLDNRTPQILPSDEIVGEQPIYAINERREFAYGLPS